MFKPTVVKLIRENGWTRACHENNLCSKCKNSSWSTTLWGNLNKGTAREAVQAFLRSLRPDSEPDKQADKYYQCYCKILHEYRSFDWFDHDEHPIVCDSCDDFLEYTEDDQEQPERTRPVDKRKNPAHEAADVAEKQHAR